jgi:MoaA/NifB/PqqE/SkfB family radical SAM enzyme
MEATSPLIETRKDHTYIRPVIITSAGRHKVEEPRRVKGWRSRYLLFRIKLHVLHLAIKYYKSIMKGWKVAKKLVVLKKKVYGGFIRKIFSFRNKYYSDYFMPAYPSKAYDDYINKKFEQLLPVNKKTNALTFIILAITTKCPFRCEHCFEWENLNKKETFTREQLKQIIDKYQDEGICQFHLSGGEPMVRIKDLLYLIRTAKKTSEFWIYTSGFNFTSENARALTEAGATGVVVSLDHYDADMHNDFRGFPGAFEYAVQAIRNAREEGLLVAVSLCVTRAFANWANLLQYVEFVNSLGVHFVQLLEPKSVGHYRGKTVLLNTEQLNVLERFYLTLNYKPKYQDYPAIIYHGYHQRRLGCFSAGYDNLYIDSAGNINACPFCQSKALNIKDLLQTGEPLNKHYQNLRCPDYSKLKSGFLQTIV